MITVNNLSEKEKRMVENHIKENHVKGVITRGAGMAAMMNCCFTNKYTRDNTDLIVLDWSNPESAWIIIKK